MKLVVTLALLGLSSVALAAAGGGHGADYIPVKFILIQAGNLAGLLLLLGYFLKNPVRTMFKDRGEKYHAHLKVAQAAKDEAEAKKVKIKERLATLHATAGESAEKAKADAAELKHQIIEDAKHLAGKLEEEAKRTAEYEAQKAIAFLRQELIDGALQESEKHLKDEVNTDVQKRLQNEFVEKIQVVHQ